MSLELIETQDGSFTFYRADIDETYHSRHGAEQESRHVFIQNGLNYYVDLHPVGRVKIYEVGFGTGLNALLSFQQNNCSIDYYGIEKYPIPENQHLKWLEKSKLDKTLGTEMLTATWNSVATFGKHTLVKSNEDLFSFKKHESTFDIIYFDAFGFRAQEEMWTLEVCQYLYSILGNNGILVTYAAKGLVRRNLQEAGFETERLPGPPGKREMLRATKVLL